MQPDTIDVGAPEVGGLQSLDGGQDGFIRDQDGFTEEEMRAHPFYASVLRPRGFGWAAGTAIIPPTGDTIVINVEKRFADGPIDPAVIPILDKFRPHLARAAVVAARLGLERARAASEALGIMGLPAAVVDGRGRLLAANAIFEQLIPSVFKDAPSGLRISDAKADRLLAEAFAALRVGAVQIGPGSIPMSGRVDRPPTIIHVVPIRRSAHDVFINASAMIVATPVVPKQVPSATVLQGLFDLTPAEARIARGIAQCQTVESLAIHLDVSRETIRSHLKSVLSKTGLRRQAELASLLAAPTLPVA